MKHEAIIPAWVYSLADYRQMFDLSEQDLDKKILDFPGGISSFNAEMHSQGRKVLTGDVSYNSNHDDMKRQAEDIYRYNEQHLREHTDALKSGDSDFIASILAAWRKSKAIFLNDFDKGVEEGRYKKMELPQLPFNEHEFQLALCSDFLFHSKVCDHCNPEELISELCRISEEVRVFPLLDESGNMPDALGPVLILLQNKGLGVEVREVPYEEQVGSNAMLRIWAKKCHL